MSGDEQARGSGAGSESRKQGASDGGGTTSPASPETRAGTPKDEEAKQGLNPSAPGETGTTPGSNAK